MTRAWRYRGCPSCGHVDRASAFTYVETYRPGWSDGSAMRQCPNCNERARTSDFPVMREKHAEDSPRAAVLTAPGVATVHRHKWSRDRSPLCLRCGEPR